MTPAPPAYVKLTTALPVRNVPLSRPLRWLRLGWRDFRRVPWPGMLHGVLVAAGGFDTQFVGPEDYDLWMRLAQGHRLMRVASPLARYRLVPGSLSMDDRKFLPQVLRVLAKGFAPGGAIESFAHLRVASLATQYWNASWMAFNRGARGTALRYWWRAYRMDHSSAISAARPWGRLLLRYLAGSREVTAGEPPPAAPGG